MKIKRTCLNCGREIEGEVHNDELGPHIVCSICGASSDIDDYEDLETFSVEFTRTIEVKAKDEDEAMELAMQRVPEDVASSCYVYVNGRSYC